MKKLTIVAIAILLFSCKKETTTSNYWGKFEIVTENKTVKCLNNNNDPLTFYSIKFINSNMDSIFMIKIIGFVEYNKNNEGWKQGYYRRNYCDTSSNGIYWFTGDDINQRFKTRFFSSNFDLKNSIKTVDANGFPLKYLPNLQHRYKIIEAKAFSIKGDSAFLQLN